MTTKTKGSKFLPENGLVDGVLDEIIPAGMKRQIPSAGSLNLSDYLENICANDDESAQLLNRGFELADKLVKLAGTSFSALGKDQRLAIVKQLETEDLEFFNALIRHTYMGYYSRGDVRKALGLSALPVQPRGYDVAEESSNMMEALTAPVRARGNCYRAC